jgi:hypothetical protein
LLCESKGEHMLCEGGGEGERGGGRGVGLGMGSNPH